MICDSLNTPNDIRRGFEFNYPKISIGNGGGFKDMLNSIQHNSGLSTGITTAHDEKSIKPVLQVLTHDERLIDYLKNTLPFCDVRPHHKNQKGVLLIDPLTGLNRIMAEITESQEKEASPSFERRPFQTPCFYPCE